MARSFSTNIAHSSVASTCFLSPRSFIDCHSDSRPATLVLNHIDRIDSTEDTCRLLLRSHQILCCRRVELFALGPTRFSPYFVFLLQPSSVQLKISPLKFPPPPHTFLIHHLHPSPTSVSSSIHFARTQSSQSSLWAISIALAIAMATEQDLMLVS
jgi:hypothetical protein